MRTSRFDSSAWRERTLPRSGDGPKGEARSDEYSCRPSHVKTSRSDDPCCRTRQDENLKVRLERVARENLLKITRDGRYACT